MRLDNMQVLVTGATGGIGQAIARAAAAKGAQVVVTGRRQELLSTLADEIGAKTIACDLADHAEVERIISLCEDTDILVANAGVPGSGNYRDLTADDVDYVIDVNLRAPIIMANALGAKMAERGSGHIVFISSLSALVSSPSNSMYNATKFGLRGFAHATRQDLAGAGVGVSVVLPGFVSEAGMFAESGVDLPPMVRTITPERVADDVIRAIEENKAEVLAAPIELRLGSKFGSLFPTLAQRVQDMPFARRSWVDLAEAQHHKR